MSGKDRGLDPPQKRHGDVPGPRKHEILLPKVQEKVGMVGDPLCQGPILLPLSMSGKGRGGTGNVLV